MKNENTKSIIGICFIGIADDGKLGYQGLIYAHVHASIYMVQYFDAFMGEPNTLEPVDLAELAGSPTACAKEPGKVLFFEDDEHMRFYLEKGFGTNLTR